MCMQTKDNCKVNISVPSCRKMQDEDSQEPRLKKQSDQAKRLGEYLSFRIREFDYGKSGK